LATSQNWKKITGCAAWYLGAALLFHSGSLKANLEWPSNYNDVKVMP